MKRPSNLYLSKSAYLLYQNLTDFFLLFNHKKRKNNIALELDEDINNEYTKYLSYKNSNNQVENTQNTHLNAPKKAETKEEITK